VLGPADVPPVGLVTAYVILPGGAQSNEGVAYIGTPVPSITALTPMGLRAGSPGKQLVIIQGTSLIPDSLVFWNQQSVAPLYGSTSDLGILVPATWLTTAKSDRITVVNVYDSLFRTSNGLEFVVFSPRPVITGLSPTAAMVSGASVALTVSGGNFVLWSKVLWNGVERLTAFVSSTELRTTLTASDLSAAGSARVSVSSPLPNKGPSNFETFAITLTSPPPTLTSISPYRTPAGSSGVTLTVDGFNFVSGSIVQWNGSDRPTTLVNNARLTAIISASDLAVAGSATVTVRSPDGSRSSPQTFTIEVPLLSLFVPIVLSAAGQQSSFFTSELTLINRGSTVATVEMQYKPAFGGGEGTAIDTLAPGQQRIIPDAIAYLRSRGMPIPDSGNRGGTLRLQFSGLASAAHGMALVRTTSAVPKGRAGLSYTAVATSVALTETSYLCGLRQDATDRSNVAIQNAGSPTDGDVLLRLTVFSGEAGGPPPFVLPEERLAPGEFKQISGVLASNGLSLPHGYLKVERMSGRAPYYAYAVINNQISSDGSFVPPFTESALVGRARLTVPVIVETTNFISELVLTNWSAAAKTVRGAFVADNVEAPGKTASFVLTLQPGQQILYPNFIQYLRSQGVAGIGAVGSAFAGGLFLTAEGGDAAGLFAGARTSSAQGGETGLFYAGVPEGQGASSTAWLYGLQQNEESRTNLGLVNMGETSGDPDEFRIEIFDGASGAKVNTVEGVSLATRRWTQLNSLLAQHAPGVTSAYARVTRVAGPNSFIAYAVVNDGAQTGQRSDDGAFVAMDTAP